MIYIYENKEELNDFLLDRLYNKLPVSRKERAASFKFRKGKISCIIGYLLFLYGYRNQTGYSDLPDFLHHENNKPYIGGHTDFYFNISHCNSAICCICGNNEVGIDIENVRKISENIINKICSPSEILQITASPKPDAKFIEFWTIKEAITKLDGTGIFQDVRKINASGTFCQTIQLDASTFLSYSTTGTELHEIKYITIEELLAL